MNIKLIPFEICSIHEPHVLINDSSDNKQSSSEIVILGVYVELWRVEMNNIIRVVKYEYDEYFKL